MNTTSKTTDYTVVLWVSLTVLFLSLFLQHEISGRQAVLFVIGVGMGVTLFHALFGFTGTWRKFISQQRGAGVRAQIMLLALSSILFFPVIGGAIPGLTAAGAVGQVGVSVLVGAFLFGIGMQLGGGCGSGTLFTVGGGQIVMLITLLFFIVGSTIGTAHLHWWLATPNVGRLSIIEIMGWLPGLLLQLFVLLVLYQVVRFIENRRFGNIESVSGQKKGLAFSEHLIRGPWPLTWGVVGLSLLGLATLLVAGYPWSVTFAFGLWGAKLWAAIGGDPGSWAYWSAGYPARALASSVLADTTSVMDFGIILGAMLAAALAGKFAPATRIPPNRLLSAIVGGLLLGYGARLAFGCNIGALLGGIASGSLHGWLWLLCGFIGNIIGVQIRGMMKLGVSGKPQPSVGV